MRLFDIVTCSESAHEHRKFCRLVGMKRVGELQDWGGIWVVEDLCNSEQFEMVGRFLTVWKPVKQEVVNGQQRESGRK